MEGGDTLSCGAVKHEVRERCVQGPRRQLCEAALSWTSLGTARDLNRCRGIYRVS